jgi:hypothetical protein
MILIHEDTLNSISDGRANQQLLRWVGHSSSDQRRAGSKQRTARAELVVAVMAAGPDGYTSHCGP